MLSALNLNPPAFSWWLFSISKSQEQFYITAPIVAVVEATNEYITGGLGQCISEMYASGIFNDREGSHLPAIYGAVTTGNTWKFLKYEDNTAYIDLKEYYIVSASKIIAVLMAMVNQKGADTLISQDIK